jgi:hypothetical protein
MAPEEMAAGIETSTPDLYVVTGSPSTTTTTEVTKKRGFWRSAGAVILKVLPWGLGGAVAVISWRTRSRVRRLEDIVSDAAGVDDVSEIGEPEKKKKTTKK